MSTIKLKISLIGNSSVGKTSLCHKYVNNTFKDTYMSTVGADYFEKTININNKEILLRIQDTSGQERFRSISPNFYRNVDGIIFVFDVTNKKSFKDVDNWLKDVNAINPQSKRILVGNKIDLLNSRIIYKENMENEIYKNMNYYETSAKSGENVQEIFTEIVRLILNDKGNKKSFNNKNENINLNQGNKSNKIEQCCK